MPVDPCSISLVGGAILTKKLEEFYNVFNLNFGLEIINPFQILKTSLIT